MCSKIFFCSHWQQTFYQSLQENENNGSQVFNCSLLSSCNHQYIDNTTLGVFTNTGTRFCLLDPYKRVPCTPACSRYRKFCHGRCVYGGMRCLFAPCSRLPYREDPGSTCSQYALEMMGHLGHDVGECKDQCCDLSTLDGATSCQECLNTNIAEECHQLSGANCWHCSGVVLVKWRQCLNQSSSVTINCLQQGIVNGCSDCICTLICYWEAEGDVCKACQEQSEFSNLFLHHQHCPQRWIYSSSSTKCYRAFNQIKSWNRASEFCSNGGGHLAQSTSNSTIQIILEALNRLAITGEYWIGGREFNVGAGIGGWLAGEYAWIGEYTLMDNSNWDTVDGYPLISGFITNPSV